MLPAAAVAREEHHGPWMTAPLAAARGFEVMEILLSLLAGCA